VLSWRDAYAVVETSAAVIVNATDLASDHGLTIWDSVVLAASAEAKCRLLLLEDLQEGFTWQGVTVTNPFAANLHPMLAGSPSAARRIGRSGPALAIFASSYRRLPEWIFRLPTATIRRGEAPSK
jgi:hypothetical protein